MDKNKEDIKEYGMLHEYHDSEKFLLKKPHLASEETANYLVIWCIDLEVEEVCGLAIMLHLACMPYASTIF